MRCEVCCVMFKYQFMTFDLSFDASYQFTPLFSPFDPALNGMAAGLRLLLYYFMLSYLFCSMNPTFLCICNKYSSSTIHPAFHPPVRILSPLFPSRFVQKHSVDDMQRAVAALDGADARWKHLRWLCHVVISPALHA